MGEVLLVASPGETPDSGVTRTRVSKTNLLDTRASKASSHEVPRNFQDSETIRGRNRDHDEKIVRGIGNSLALHPDDSS